MVLVYLSEGGRERPRLLESWTARDIPTRCGAGGGSKNPGPFEGENWNITPGSLSGGHPWLTVSRRHR